ncbi:hypothetical protein ACFYWS_12475 [Streptomyces sp. NPDC002795]|uniref:hypothetical protein n=1 Tax=Streptomyces sp. NPDC002795 TaxID=3364665 RepID=UPI003694BF0D
MPRSRTLVNRIALALFGLVAVAGGGRLGSGHTSWRSTVPEQWSAPSLRGQEWWTPTVMAVSVAVAVLLAWWGARQLRSGGRRLLALPTSRSHLRTRALEDTLSALVEDVDGVAHCRSRVRGGARTDRLDAVLRVRLHHDTTPSTVLPPLTRIASDTGDALAPYRFRMRIRFSAPSHRRPHVR